MRNKSLDLTRFEKGKVNKFWYHIVDNGIGEAVKIPMMIARGAKDGPTLGITAALHGNELNGIPVIQKVFTSLNLQELKGTLIGVLAVNIPAFIREQRRFNDDVDLNRIAPGKNDGNISQVYIYRFIDQIVRHFNYLIDLHTASFGRINSHYVRADMQDPEINHLARLQNPDIILNNGPKDKSLRAAAADFGIKAITVELRDPHVLQRDVIQNALEGIHNVMFYLNMQEGEAQCKSASTILCENSYWIYTKEGGLLTVSPAVTSRLMKGQRIAIVRDIFGEIIEEYFSPEDGIVIGKSTNPVNQTGSRILHLGVNYREISVLN